MELKRTVLFGMLLIGQLSAVLSVEPITGAYALGAAMVSLGIASFNVVKCRFYECCTDRWIVNNVTALNAELDKRLYGQHLVKKVVTSQILGHIKNPQPNKALVLSFHGPTGTGKNHVSRIIAEALYRKGMKSENVRMISGTQMFPHQEMVSLYKDKLRDIIETQVGKCGRSLFIFDEIDKLPKGLIDTIKPYLDHHEHLHGVDYRRAMFIFLSNSGSGAVTQYVEQTLNDGLKREDIRLVEVEKIIAKAAINSEYKGGLWHSGLISNNLVSAFIPFLPLERKHIHRCIEDTMIMGDHYKTRKDIPKDMVYKVTEELLFYPEDSMLFSVTGCKRVAEKVNLIMLS